MNRPGVVFWVAVAAGFAAGAIWWSGKQERHQRALYSPRRLQRMAALSWLSGRPTAETVMMLREYVGWEHNPVLRRRARRLLTRFENALA